MLLTAGVTGFISGAGLIIAIGAQNAFVLRQGLLKRYVGMVVLVTSLGDLLLIACGVTGMGAVAQERGVMMHVLRFGGAAFLCIYGMKAAWRALNSQASLGYEGEGTRAGALNVLLTCAAFTFLNPHVYLDTMLLLGSLSTHYAGLERWAFGAGACTASVVWFSALGHGARLLQPAFKTPQAWRVLDAVVAVFMLTLSIVMLVNAL